MSADPAQATSVSQAAVLMEGLLDPPADTEQPEAAATETSSDDEALAEAEREQAFLDAITPGPPPYIPTAEEVRIAGEAFEAAGQWIKIPRREGDPS